MQKWDPFGSHFVFCGRAYLFHCTRPVLVFKLREFSQSSIIEPGSNKRLFVLSVEEATFYENTQNIIKNPAWDHESRRRYLSHRATDLDETLSERSSNSQHLITMHLTWIKGSPGASRTQYVLKSDNGTYSGPTFGSKMQHLHVHKMGPDRVPFLT